LSLYKGVSIQIVELRLVIWYALLRFGWTVLKTFMLVFQLVVESLLAHVRFFLRSFGLVFQSVAELKICLLVGSYYVVSLW